MRYIHRPVMVKEVLDFLSPHRGGLYVDATCGEGGHSEAILAALPEDGRLICIDVDAELLRIARQRLKDDPRVLIRHASYTELPEILQELGERASGVLLDLGLSSYHLETPERGFSFDAPVLDMRFDRQSSPDGLTLLKNLSQTRLAEIFRNYGEERKARFLARHIYHALRRDQINSCADLARLVERLLPRKGRIHPATRLFQAIRIAVNRELENLKEFLEALPSILAPRGRLVAISYHSLEDRLVKRALKKYAAEGTMRLLTKKVVRAKEEEVLLNRRARSAKLRAAEAVG